MSINEQSIIGKIYIDKTDGELMVVVNKLSETKIARFTCFAFGLKNSGLFPRTTYVNIPNEGGNWIPL